MFAVSDAYIEAIQSPDRMVDIYLSLGTDIDITAADDIVSIEGDFLPMSNVSQLTDANYSMTELLATYENGGIPTAPSYGVLVPPLSAKAYPPEVGIWSSALSDSTGAVDFHIRVTMAQAHVSALRLYTSGPAITSGEVTFTDEEGTTVTKPLEPGSQYASVSGANRYLTIDIHVTGISEPNSHVRIVEIEFGTSFSLSRDKLSGSITLLQELDPTELSMPLSELDFSILNVLGEYDVDNPVTLFNQVAIGFPIDLSFTLTAPDGTRTTVPCGRYSVAAKRNSENNLEVTAYDLRWPLGDIYRPWTLNTTESLGLQLDALLTENDIPHTVSSEVLGIMPYNAYTFNEETSLLSDLLLIQQAYAVYFIPDRTGSVQVVTTLPSDTYGAVDVNGLFTWPSMVEFTSYNYVSVQYGGVNSETSVEIDLRTDPSMAKTVLRIANPLVMSQSVAQTIANRLVSRLYSTMTETEWLGDPAMDLGDVVSIPGKWTQGEPPSYSVIRRESTFDGVFRSVIRGTR